VGHEGCDVNIAGCLGGGQVSIKVAEDDGGEVWVLGPDVGNVTEVDGWVISWGYVGSNEDPLLASRRENCGDGVRRDGGRVLDMPVGSVISPEQCDAAFVGAVGTGG